jgi:hypothetical protein
MENRPVREFEFELPVGYVDEDGRLHRTAALRKMTGHEEAILADRKMRHNGGVLVTELLTNCLRQLGEITPLNRKVISQLTSPDRNYLLLELRKITFGRELEATYVCPVCGETTRAVQNLDDLPVRRLNGEGAHLEIVVELEDGWEDKDGTLYTTMVFRLPTGADEEKIAGAIKDNPSRGMNALLTRCLMTLGDMSSSRREALGTKVISDLTMGDRARIERAFRQEVPGVDLTQEVECDTCGRAFETTLDLTGFFSARQGAKTSSARRSSS